MEGEEFIPVPSSGQAGVGRDLPFIQEILTPRMVNQEANYSCVIACVRQLLRDAGLEMTEDDLTKRIGVLEGFGSEFEQAAKVISDLHPQWMYVGGSIDPEQVQILLRRTPWVARVRTFSGRYHAIIVDGLKDNILTVRDPWGKKGPSSGHGTEATIIFDDFLEHWRYGIHGSIFSNKVKGSRSSNESDHP